jgi:transcription-repair coupling factor (superfamily II helicase)
MIQEQQSGFVAGTLVHTDKGLVPIEQIQVGDLVLSRYANGEGERIYKRVTKTFKSPEKKSILRINFAVDSIRSLAMKTDQKFDMFLFCTEDHAFWVQDHGWVLAGDLTWEHKLVTFDGDTAELRDEQTWPAMMRTSIPEVAICSGYSERNDGFSMLVDFRQGRPILLGGGESEFWGLSYDRRWHPSEEIYKLPADDNDLEVRQYTEATFAYDCGDDELFYTHVYNIEVENNHTYFVGNAGIWVHDASANIS